MARVSVLVTVRDATAAGLRRVRRSIDSLNRGILSTLAAAFSDGVGQALALGFRNAMSNPYVAAAVVSLVAALTLQLAAGLAAALTLAFGGAFVALGVMAVKGSKRVRNAFAKELKGLKKLFREAAEPLIPAIEHAAKLMGRLGREFAPMFEKAMAAAAPVLEDFMDRAAKGLRQGGFLGFEKMMKAFNALLANIKIEKFFSDLGKAFDNLALSVLNNRKAVAGVFDALLSLIPKAINLVADLTNAWGKVQPFFSAVWRTIKLALTPAVTVLGIVFKVLSDLMAAAAPFIEILNGALQSSNDLFQGLVDKLGELIGPIWTGFIDGLTEGGKVLGEALVPVLEDFYEVLGITGRRILEVFLPGLLDSGDKAQSLGDKVREGVLGALTNLAEWITEHRETIREWMMKGSDAAVWLAEKVKWVIQKIIEFIGWIIENRAEIAKWGERILTIGGFFIWLADKIAWVIGKVIELFGWFSKNWDLVLQVTGIGLITQAIRLAKDLWGWVSRNWRANLRFTGLNSITTAIKWVKRLWDWVNRNWFRSVVLSISIPGFSTLKSAWKMITSAFAHGGIRGAATGGLRGGMTLVGEHGPELIDLAPGSRVRSNPDTRRLLSQGQRAGMPTLLFKSSGRRVDDLLLEILREAIHQRGGDPVAVLGG